MPQSFDPDFDPQTSLAAGTTLRMVDDRILLRRKDPETMQGSLYLPPKAQEKNVLAEVIAVGPGRRIVKRVGDLHIDIAPRVPCTVKPGDLVLMPEYFGDEVILGGVAHRIVREIDLLAIVQTAD